MGTRSLLLAFVPVTLLASGGLIVFGTSSPAPSPSPATGNGIAVVELFTSEGCSSCPPADRLLKDLVDRTKQEGRAVFPLAFHVDYWDRLGWKDTFSKAEWSTRQRGYAAQLPGGTYTPECVVNGKEAFVGSDRDAMDTAVNEGLMRPARVRIESSAVRQGDRYEVDAMVDGGLKDRDLVAVLVEDGLFSQVTKGENGGRKLEHEHVVRALAHVMMEEGRTRYHLQLDAGAVQADARVHVIVFAQASGQGLIDGATEAVVSGTHRDMPDTNVRSVR